MMTHEPTAAALTFWDYLEDFTDFLAMFAGWGIVVIVILTLVVMITRQIVIGTWPKRLPRVTIELYIAFTMIVLRPVILHYVLRRSDLPQPLRVFFWLAVFVLSLKFFYFALWDAWLRPAMFGFWRFVIKPRAREALAVFVALLVVIGAIVIVHVRG